MSVWIVPCCLVGVFAESLEWDYIPQGPITVGEEVPLVIDATATAKSLKDIGGTGLWKVNFFGTRDPSGNGERVGFSEQLLLQPQQDLTLESAVGALQFDGLRASFDIGSVGCAGADVDHICLEYGRGDAPDPNFYFFTETGAGTLITCKRLDCGAEIKMKRLLAPLEDGKLVETIATNSLEFDVKAISTEDSPGIVGNDLWQVTMFGSADPNGLGFEIEPQVQVLNRRQASMSLEPGGEVQYGRVAVNFDMSRVTCTQIEYVCMRLKKNPSASIGYTLTAVPDESVLQDCSEVHCGADNQSSATELQTTKLKLPPRAGQFDTCLMTTCRPRLGYLVPA
ncbi:LOW QUALITY PROTEIN: uncharacterized protein [Amphiura filiformis]|uniref:LOW QUALITY PROTEIN: uncharacterized protein n=1 Tax=Amphiura filiformis TaxID=82378 RepID=UPI003B223BB2